MCLLDDYGSTLALVWKSGQSSVGYSVRAWNIKMLRPMQMMEAQLVKFQREYYWGPLSNVLNKKICGSDQLGLKNQK